MLLAIDVGNTHSVFGLWTGFEWKPVYRFSTPNLGTEDEIFARLKSLEDADFQLSKITKLAIASVNPMVDGDLERLGTECLKVPVVHLRSKREGVMPVLYEPADAVGADRIANALGALALFAPPMIIVDFGTATTFDCIDAQGAYMGGAILPGPDTLMDSLTSKTAKLPRVPLETPERAIGRSTKESLQSGLVIGYSGSISHILTSILLEMPGARCLCTGGLAPAIQKLVPEIGEYFPNLTLDGMRIWIEKVNQ